MREMDPTKHIPVDDNIPTKPDIRKNRPLRIIFFQVLAILYTLGLVFYLDYYYSENDSVIWDQNVAVNETTTTSDVDKFAKAKTMIEDGMAKWEDLETVEYTIRGGDGDEDVYIEYHYKMDFETGDYDFVSYDLCASNEEPTQCVQEKRYVSIDGKITNIVDGKKESVDDYTLSFTLPELKEMINTELGDEKSLSFDRVFNMQKGFYGFEDEQVTYVSIDYYRKPSGNAFTNLFKAYADVILDKSSLEVVIDSEGNILEVKMPYYYDEIGVHFASYNQPLEITLPEEE